MTATIDISGFNRGMAGFVDKLGLAAPVVLKKEMGELVKTLIKVTPGADSEKIRKNITEKFEMLQSEFNSLHDTGGGDLGGKQGIHWYAVDSRFLYGVAEKDDKRAASVEELKQLSYHTTRHGRLLFPIRGHKRQRALIYQTILTKASTVKKLIAAKIKNRGRLKAGWLVAVGKGQIKLTGGNQPPKWVTQHMNGARGYSIDSTATKNFPSFTIANTAAGVGNSKLNLNWLVQNALNIRGKAMAANLGLFMRGKKNLADYAK